MGVKSLHGLQAHRPSPDIRLVGRDDEEEARLLESGTGFGDPGENFKLREARWRIRFAVANQRAVDDPVAVEEHGAF